MDKLVLPHRQRTQSAIPLCSLCCAHYARGILRPFGGKYQLLPKRNLSEPT